ncbi:esterase [Amylibacter ulvae]|uniref:Esterase n=1 Tax=Paramylibacter ulvae TaxID=1651968 RepID=A0ABQ3D094_9RHOB|nr:alpha/beta hydrolase [Amylibacter ulvae]GHA52215.1 esterase [Amylibacter ulvae]
MAGFQITDWDDAYENSGHIVDSALIRDAWAVDAAAFRANVTCKLDLPYSAAFGATDRAKYDVFFPDQTPKGLFVFVHGGYWQATDKSIWSHLAQGAVDAGWVAVLPSYDLCPDVSIATIIKMVGAAIDHAGGQYGGPIVLAGHSAGGHLVASMCQTDAPIAPDIAKRIRHVVPISGLFDLRPLLQTKINDALGLDMSAAIESSPALKIPRKDARITAWVGGGERSEFLRQNALIANIWRGLGIWSDEIVEPDRHHFNVIDGLRDHNSALMQTILRPF